MERLTIFYSPLMYISKAPVETSCPSSMFDMKNNNMQE
jgi:hypothetical protein